MTILVYHLQDLASKSPIIVVRKEPFCARVSNGHFKVIRGFKIVLRLAWGPIKGYKVTGFIASLKLKVQTFLLSG